MRRLINLIEYIMGRSGVHLVDPDLNFIKKNIRASMLPRVEDVVYFDKENYEVTKVLHNFESDRHNILIVIVDMPQRIIADATITFD
jgi:hypothetical protein